VSTRPLTDTAVRNLKPAAKPYKKSDGGGLHLLVTPKGSKLWRMAYRFQGKQKLLSFGKYPIISLSKARSERDAAKALLADGIDPSSIRKAEREKREEPKPVEETWKTLCQEWWQKRRREEASPTTLKKLTWLLEKTYPALGEKDPREITAPELLAVLRNVEAGGTFETAKRLRSTCGQVFRYGIATGRADRDVAADLRGALTSPKPKHHPAILDPKGIGALMRAIRDFEGDPTTRTGLLLAAYTFLRSGEIRSAKWSDVDWKTSRLTIPAKRMKMDRPHIVPLATQVQTILREIRPITGDSVLILPSLRSKGRPMSENTMNAALRRMGYSKTEMVTHGFRTIASTTLNENGFRWDWIERQLAHVEGNKVRAAYNAAEYLKERTKMMQWYADYLDGLAEGEVV
jgi:integrase